MIQKHSKGDAIMVSDVGNTKCLLVVILNSIDKSNVTSGGLGTMGFASPAAIMLRWGCQTG
jgi:acetolactate synthase-1/2/3 large subunit